MPTTLSTSSDFQQNVTADKDTVSVVHFGAEWCPPCKDLNTALDEFAKVLPPASAENGVEVNFYQVDAEVLPTETEKLLIESVPQVLAFRNGQLKGRVLGAKLTEIQKMVETVRGYLHNNSIPINDRLKRLTTTSDIVIFIKGTPEEPRCGFTAQLLELLKPTQVKYDSFNIMENEEVRKGLKSYANWPTYPQVYVQGKLVGGLDVMKELKENGELMSTLCPRK